MVTQTHAHTTPGVEYYDVIWQELLNLTHHAQNKEEKTPDTRLFELND